MDEQKLNEAAEEYGGISEDKFSNSAKKYDAYDMTDAFSSGAHWHRQQNTWRKPKDELPECKKLTCGIYYSKYLNIKVIGLEYPLVGYYVSANDDEFFDFVETNYISIPQEDIIEWKYIED